MLFQKIMTAVSTVVLSVTAFAVPVFAAGDRLGMAVEKQLGFQPAATEIMEHTTSFHNGLLIVITLITLFVFALLGWIILRYNRKANPVPSKTTHNVLLEVVWTILPIIILVGIGIPSIRLLYFQDTIPEADVVIKVTGHQWYWSYEYPDANGLAFDAIMLPSEYWDSDRSADVQADRDAAIGDIQSMLALAEAPEIFRLLDTDTRLVVPVNQNVKLILTADDVIHAWAIPSFGVKLDAVPGRINELWFNVRETGTYYGQCSELCGVRHAFMPIVVEVVSEEDYQAWLARAGAFYAEASTPSAVRVATAANK
jgi:cytochrome c oxidase subunit II